MSEQQQCADCKKLSPETDTSHTLISSRYGWRLTRARDAAGVVSLLWRCPRCWEAMKAAEARASDAKKHESARGIFARARRRLAGTPSDPPPR